MTWLSDPRVFNVAIILMFVGAAVRWGVAGNWTQAGYWGSAALLNIFVTLGMK